MESKFWQEYKKRDVQVLAISIGARGDATEKAKGYATQHKLTFPVLVDAKNETARLFGVRGVPTNAVIGKDGKLAFLKSGYSETAILGALDAALNTK